MGLFGMKCSADETFLLGLAGEFAGISGVPKNAVSWYALDKASTYDPLYGESVGAESFFGPYSFGMTLQFEEADGHLDLNTSADVNPEREYDAIGGIARTDWRANVQEVTPPDVAGHSEPRIGDVLSVFAGDDKLWFDVVKVERQGYVLTTAMYTSWKITMKRRASFEPSRRVT